MDFKTLRKQSGLTQQAFADYFEIPKRTVEDWERGISKPAPYLLKLLDFKLKADGIIK